MRVRPVQLTAAALLLTGLLPAHARTLAEVRASGTLRVATSADFEPFNFVKAGSPAGFEVDLAEAVAIGVMLFLLFYLKLTYFGLSAGIIVVGCIVTRGLWRGAVVAVVPLIAGMIALELLHPGLLSAYRADLARAAAANTVLMRSDHVQRAIAVQVH